MVDLDELKRLAEGASDEAEGDWFCADLLEPGAPDISASVKARAFVHAMSPDTAKKLIAVALAAQKALAALEEAQTYTASPSWSPSMTMECKDAEVGLRTALEELK